MTEDFSYWQGQLAGQNPSLPDLMPQPSCYRDRDDPVMIRVLGDEMFAWLGRKGQQKKVRADAGFAETRFSFFCRNAIPSKLYDEVTNHGAAWPDAAPDVRGEIGDNLPSDPFERLLVELESHEERVAAFLQQEITTEDQATKAGLWSSKIAGIGKELDGMREAEKRPHDEAAKAVQAKFKPKVDLAAGLARKLKDHMAPWLLAKKRRAEAEERERQEASRKAAESLEMPAPEPAQTRAPSKVVTGGVSVRTRQIAVITDLPAACAFYATWPNPPRELVKLIEGFAEKNLKAGSAVPGAELKTIESVA